MKNLWTVPEDFEFDPCRSTHTVYVATRGYRHSEDRGSGLSTFELVRKPGRKLATLSILTSRCEKVLSVYKIEIIFPQK